MAFLNLLNLLNRLTSTDGIDEVEERGQHQHQRRAGGTAGRLRGRRSHGSGASSRAGLESAPAPQQRSEPRRDLRGSPRVVLSPW